jgi:hypothetical protein
MFILQSLNDGIVKARTHPLDGLVFRVGPGPVRQQYHGKLFFRIAPEGSSRIAEMPE